MTSTLAIYTGSNDVAFHFAMPMLKSLRLHNDLGLPVIFFDFGMSTAQRSAVAAIVGAESVVRAANYTDRFTGLAGRMKDSQGILGVHLARTMKKVAILECGRYDNFVWLDADTIILEPLSRFVPAAPYGEIWAQRISRSGIESQLTASEGTQAAANALAERMRLSGKHANINSGVFAMSAAAAARLVTNHADFLIGQYGQYLFGDQSFINLAAWAEGIEMRELDPRVNVCVPPSFAGHVEVRDGKLGPDILLDGKKPWVYHFLNYKPAPNKSPTSPQDQAVQSFYEGWCEATLVS
jgi:hypothetical protein